MQIVDQCLYGNAAPNYAHVEDDLRSKDAWEVTWRDR